MEPDDRDLLEDQPTPKKKMRRRGRRGGPSPSGARSSSPTRAGVGGETQPTGEPFEERTTLMPVGMPLRKTLCYLTIGVVVLLHVLSGPELVFPPITEPGRSCIRVAPFLPGVVKAPDTTTVDSSALEDKESLFDGNADKLPVFRGVLHPPFPLGQLASLASLLSVILLVCW
jgi:hypothetical protein